MIPKNKARPLSAFANQVFRPIAVAFLYLLLNFAAFAQSNSGRPNAERIYVDQGCAVCHGLMGHGGVGPGFVGDHFLVLGDYVAAKILLGRGQMPGFADKLSDDQIAAVASYIRQSWGNKIGSVSADQVRRLREQTAKKQ